MLTHLILTTLVAFALLLLPGYALLRCCVSAQELGFLSRLTIAPGVTTAFAALLFTWARVFSLKLGPLAPWLLILLAILSMLVPTGRGTLHHCLLGRRGSFRSCARLDRRKSLEMFNWVPHSQ